MRHRRAELSIAAYLSVTDKLWVSVTVTVTLDFLSGEGFVPDLDVSHRFPAT